MEATATPTVVPSVPSRVLQAASDERLVAWVRAGDERAFEMVYDRYHRQLLSFCRHMLGTREEAEDALQQVLVSAHGQLRRDGRPVQLRPWLYAIARNRCLSTLRARRETVAIADLPEPSTDGLAVAAEVQQRQDIADVLVDLRRLPDDQRAALVLAELDDLTHDEIALALDVRRDKVKALVFQAREALLGYREARDADCVTIREQLATLRGGALRRAPLQRHLAVCPACTTFRDEVKRQRAVMAAVLPVVPAIGLKEQIFGAVHAASAGGAAAAGTGGAAAGLVGLTGSSAGTASVAGGAAATGALGGGVGGTLAAVGSSSLVVKALAVVAVAASTGGGVAAVRSGGEDSPRARPAAGTVAPGATSTGVRTPSALGALLGTPGTGTPVIPAAGGGRATAPGQTVAAAAKLARSERAKAKASSFPGGSASAPGQATDRVKTQGRGSGTATRRQQDAFRRAVGKPTRTTGGSGRPGTTPAKRPATTTTSTPIRPIATVKPRVAPGRTGTTGRTGKATGSSATTQGSAPARKVDDAPG